MVNYLEVNETKFTIKGCLSIYKVPNWELVENYVFQKEDEENDYNYYFERPCQSEAEIYL